MDPEVAERIMESQHPGYLAWKHYIPDSMIPEPPEPTCEFCERVLEDPDDRCNCEDDDA
jgi:hypothetical protein